MEEINLNKSNKDELTKVKGIGSKKAERIIAYRDKNGFFNSVEDLLDVRGFGEKNISKIKDQLKVKDKENKVEIIFNPEEYNLNPEEINEVHLVGEMNGWNPADKSYKLKKRKNESWSGRFSLEKGTEYKIMYDSQDWESNRHIGDSYENLRV